MELQFIGIGKIVSWDHTVDLCQNYWRERRIPIRYIIFILSTSLLCVNQIRVEKLTKIWKNKKQTNSRHTYRFSTKSNFSIHRDTKNNNVRNMIFSLDFYITVCYKRYNFKMTFFLFIKYWNFYDFSTLFENVDKINMVRWNQMIKPFKLFS